MELVSIRNELSQYLSDDNHINKNVTYKDLQKIAKVCQLPRNLKKQTMRDIIEARLNGKDQLVKLILKEVREDRSLRKKLREESAIRTMEHQTVNVIKIGNSHFQECNSLPMIQKSDTKIRIRDILFQSTSKRETLSKNVTICKTEMKTEYRTFETPKNSTDVGACCSSTEHLYQTAPPLWPTTTARMFLSASLGTPIYSAPLMKSESQLVTNFTTRQYGDTFQQTEQYTNICCGSNISQQLGAMNKCSSAALDNSYNFRHQEICSENYPKEFFPPPPGVWPPLHYLPETRMKAVHCGSALVPQEFMLPNDSTPMDYLAQIANMLEEDIGRSADGGNVCAVKNESTESKFYLPGSTFTSQEIPTWNNYLEICSNKSLMTKCQFDCPVVCKTKEAKMDHEIYCRHQPVNCPSINCCWVNQLASLSTHIFNFHNMDVVHTSEASFTLNFGNDFAQNGLMNAEYEGPRRQTFFQLVNRRLFVTFVIGNLQSMQLYVYVQYVDDYYNWLSTGAIEVLRPDGVPYQWKGRLLPLSVSSTRLIPHRRCLIFNMNTCPRVTRFVIHVKIRNHDPSSDN